MITLTKNKIYTIRELLSLFNENVVFSPKYALLTIVPGTKAQTSGIVDIDKVLDFQVTGCPRLQNHMNYIDCGYGAIDNAITLTVRGAGTVVKIAYRYKKKELYCELPYVPGYMERSHYNPKREDENDYNFNIPGQLTFNFNQVLVL